MSSPTITLSAHCHCRRANLACAIPATSSPLKSAICHCNSCRYSTGQLFGTFAVIPSPDTPDTSALTAYQSSAGLSRYFCPTCGASVSNIEPHEWEFASGLLTAETRKALGLTRVQLWVSDTEDGGCAGWLDAAAGRRGINWENRESSEVSLQQVAEMRKQSLEFIAGMRTDDGEEKLDGGCKCGKVRFYVLRPTEADGKGWYKASFCACSSCRLTTGFEITAWTTVPRSKLFFPDGSPLDVSEAIEGLERYESSPGVERFFCRGCGATAFYWNRGLKARRENVDVAVGLLRAKGEVLAQNWFKWDKIVQYTEDAIDTDFVEGFAKALRED